MVNKVIDVLGYQASQPVTSIGANCREANHAEPRKDFTQIRNPQTLRVLANLDHTSRA